MVPLAIYKFRGKKKFGVWGCSGPENKLQCALLLFIFLLFYKEKGNFCLGMAPSKEIENKRNAEMRELQ